jgi:hypothetical protein
MCAVWEAADDEAASRGTGCVAGRLRLEASKAVLLIDSEISSSAAVAGKRARRFGDIIDAYSSESCRCHCWQQLQGEVGTETCGSVLFHESKMSPSVSVA